MENKMEYQEIEIKNIELLENIRSKPVKEDLSDLMNSIKQTGLMQPIGVKEVKNGFLLLWGYRRLCAYKKLGWKTIPARVFINENDVLSEEDFLILNATENIHRKSTNVIELGRICLMLRKTMSSTEIASRLSIPNGRVTDCITQFKRVPEKYRDKILIFDNARTKNRDGKIPASLSNIVVRMRNVNDKEREKVLDWAVKEEVSSEKIKVLGQLLKEGNELKKAMDIVDQFKSITFKMVVRKDAHEKLVMEEQKTFHTIVKDMIKNKIGADNVY